MVGESNAILSIFRQILKISRLCRLPVLVTGETGTGKELIARAIHQLDPERGKGPFVAVNCGAINPNLAESELFGHKKGAFTGAEKERKGLFRSAHDGVIFLDEIGDLTRELQAKLLRVLQEDRVLSVGYDQEFQVNYRIIAATNRNLTKMMEQGEFRNDLFHRLNVLTIHVPPLRERKADINPLVFYFLAKYQGISSSKFSSVGRDFLEALSQLEFPGNVRQLENIVQRTLVNKKDNIPLSLNNLPPEIWQQLCLEEVNDLKQIESICRASGAAILSQQTPLKEFIFSNMAELLEANKWNLSKSLNYCEKLLIKAALHQAQGNQSRTAQLLGITPRSIYNKLRKHQLNP